MRRTNPEKVMVGKKTRIVVCRRSWEFSTPRPIVANRGYELVKRFWCNGEGWYTVRDEDGTLIEAPDVFFSDGWTRRDA